MAIHVPYLQVDRAKGAVDSAELINMKNRSSTLPANFELVKKTRHIVDRFPCWTLGNAATSGVSGGKALGGVPSASTISPTGLSSSPFGSDGGRTEAQLTLCNDCIIVDRRFAFGACVRAHGRTHVVRTQTTSPPRPPRLLWLAKC